MEQLIYTTEKKKSFKLVGYNDEFSLINGKENYESIISKWASLTKTQMEKLFTLMDGFIPTLVGASQKINDTTFNYSIAVTTKENSVDQLDTYKIPELEWIVIPGVGAIFSSELSAMVELKEYVLQGWIELEGYRVMVSILELKCILKEI